VNIPIEPATISTDSLINSDVFTKLTGPGETDVVVGNFGIGIPSNIAINV
jgi:hypothetical protein